MISRVRQKTNQLEPCHCHGHATSLSILTMMTRANKLKRMTMRKAKTASSENRTNVDAESIGVCLLEITDYL